MLHFRYFDGAPLLITGFNTDIEHNSKVYHIQTEDKGLQNPFIESLVYVGGEILACKKTSYAEQVEKGADEKTIGGLMEQQHRIMIAAIKRGRLDHYHSSSGQAAAPEVTPEDLAQVSAPVSLDDRTLDQVIIDYLASEAESEHLELVMLTSCEFFSGQAAELRVGAKKSLSQQPIPDAIVEVKVISTVEPPRVLFQGKTGADGAATIRCSIPSFADGTAAVIVSAHSTLGNDEVKQLIKRKKG